MRTKIEGLSFFVIACGSVLFYSSQVFAVSINGTFTLPQTPIQVAQTPPTPLFLNDVSTTTVPRSGSGTRTISFGTNSTGTAQSQLTYAPCTQASCGSVVPGTITDLTKSYEIGTIAFDNGAITIPSANDFHLKVLFTPSFSGPIKDASGKNFTFGIEVYEIFTSVTLNTFGPIDITNATNNGGGLIRITTADPHGLQTNDFTSIRNVNGTIEANRDWQILKVNDNTFDLQQSQFQNPYISGGTSTGDFDFIKVAAGPQSQGFSNLNPLITSNALGNFNFTNESGVPEDEIQIATVSAKFTSLGAPIDDFLTFEEATDPIESSSSLLFNTSIETLETETIPLGLADFSFSRIVSGGGFIRPIPEPSTVVLLGSGLLTMLLWRKRNGK